jgi:hypothetical protein
MTAVPPLAGPVAGPTSTELLALLDLPGALVRALNALPKRLVFHSATADVLQVGLRHAQVVRDLALTHPVTVIVTYGCAHVEHGGESRKVFEGGEIRLPAGRACDLTAVGDTDLLLVLSRRAARTPAVPANLRRAC